MGVRHDGFGHIEFSSSQTTVAQLLVNALNEAGLRARGQVPGTDQRHAILHASPVDLAEAYRVAEKAVALAADGKTGVMTTIRRAPGPAYRPEYDAVDLAHVAGVDRPFPKAWIAPSGTDVTDAFVRYAEPLVGEAPVAVPVVSGRLRFACLRPSFAEKRLPPYVPVGRRDER